MTDTQAFDEAFGASEGTDQQAPAEAAPPPPPAVPRDDKGRFARAAEDAEAPAAEGPPSAPPPAAPEPPQPGHIPLAAMLDEREKRQALERQLAELQKEREAQLAEARLAEAEPADRLAAELYAQKLEMSRGFAEARYGKEAVDQVHAWAGERCDADPFFNERMRASRNPYEDAMQAFTLEQLASKVTPERLAQFEAWEAAQRQAAAAQPPPQPAVQPPPSSLVHATSAAGASGVAVGEGLAFRNAIG